MGLFNFFKKKSTDDLKETSSYNPIHTNSVLLQSLHGRLIKDGFKVDKHPQYASLTVNNEIEIATVIIDNPHNHPSILHLMIMIIHPKYFPEGITENIVGAGTTINTKIDSVLNNFINTTFQPIYESLSNSHRSCEDFSTQENGKKILWHINLGSPGLQGKWDEQPNNLTLFNIVSEKVKSQITSNKLNWLKLYISKQANGTIIGECLLNNEHWEEGLVDISDYASSWDVKDEFKGIKQFILFKKCDLYIEYKKI